MKVLSKEKDMDCLISVIVPVYKVEKYIRRCVDSVLNQTFTDFELILVDDGSPDNCGAICDEYALKDNRIHVIHKENGGLSDARNAGIDWAFANSNSEWITFIDSDDWIHPKYLEALYNAVKKSGCEISICGFEETEGNNPNVDEERLQPIMVYTEEFFCEKNVNAIVAWGKLYKKELFREICYPVGKLHEDEFTTYKLLFKYISIAIIEQPLYFYFFNNQSITKKDWNPRRFDGLDAIEEQLDFFKLYHPRVFLNRKDKYFDYLLRLRNNIIPESGIENPEKYQKIVTKRLRRALWRYHAFPPNKYGDCYVTVYPFLGKIRSIIKK